MFNSISLTVYNRTKLTEVCINSILERTPRNQYEFIVIDNGSQPDTIEMLKKYEHHFDHLVLNHRNNLGSATNDAWKLASPRADWLIAFGNDLYCMKGWYENFKLLTESEIKPDIVYCMQRMQEDIVYDYIQLEADNYSTYKVEKGDLPPLIFGGGLAIKKHLVAAYGLKFREGKDVWDGVSIYTEFGKDAHKAGLKFSHLGKPCILNQDCEFANPEYADYYKKTFGYAGRVGSSKLYSEIPKWKSLQIRGGEIQNPDEYYKGSDYKIGEHYRKALETKESKEEFKRIDQLSNVKSKAITKVNPKKTKVVLISDDKDWANIGAMFALCLNAVGVSARSFTKGIVGNKPFIHSEFFGNNIRLLKNAITDETKAIIWMHSKKMKLDVDLSKKKQCVFHGGSLYRSDSKNVNKIFKNADAVFIQTAELLLLSDRKDKIWLLPTAYVGDIKPIVPLQGKKLIVGHFPSNGTGLKGIKGDIKGTIGINKVMKQFKDRVDWRFIDAKISWRDNLNRVNACDVYIESLNYSSTSKNKHDWSIAALEAAALGKIVITNFVYGRDIYEKEYGPHKIQIANTEAELKKTIERLLSMSDEELVQLKQETLDWVAKAHSLEAIGNRIKEGLKLD